MQVQVAFAVQVSFLKGIDALNSVRRRVFGETASRTAPVAMTDEVRAADLAMPVWRSELRALRHMIPADHPTLSEWKVEQGTCNLNCTSVMLLMLRVLQYP